MVQPGTTFSPGNPEIIVNGTSGGISTRNLLSNTKPPATHQTLLLLFLPASSMSGFFDRASQNRFRGAFVKKHMKQIKNILSVAKLPLSLLFLLLIYGPAESYFSNVNDFSFDIYDLLVMFVPVFIVCSIVVILMLFLANRVSNRMLSILLAISLGALLAFFVQGTFFQRIFPLLTGI